jgi:hypothetical protein
MQAMDCLTTSQIQRYIHSAKKTTEAGTILRQPLLLVRGLHDLRPCSTQFPGDVFRSGATGAALAQVL